MSWTLAASGKLGDEVAHLEQEFVDELHALLAKFGMHFAHFQGPTVDRLTTGDVPASTGPAAPAETPSPAEAAAAADPAPADPAPSGTKASKAAAKTTTG